MSSKTVNLTPYPAILNALIVNAPTSQLVCELIDNAIDARASIIDIQISSKNITVTDNGNGMDLNVLNVASKLGKPIKYDREKSNIGRYGFGLKMGSWSMGRRFKIITQKKNNTTYKTTLDLDKALENDNWGTATIKTSKTQIKGGHGTSIIIDKLNKPIEDISDIRNYLAKIYDRYLSINTAYREQKTIRVNGKVIDPADSGLHLEGDMVLPRRATDQDYEITLHGQRRIVSTRRIIIKPARHSGQSFRKGCSIDSQGLYVYRGNRLLFHDPRWLTGRKTGDGHRNYMRLVIYLDASWDSDIIYEAARREQGISLSHNFVNALNNSFLKTTIRNMQAEYNAWHSEETKESIAYDKRQAEKALGIKIHKANHASAPPTTKIKLKSTMQFTTDAGVIRTIRTDKMKWTNCPSCGHRHQIDITNIQ